MKKSFNKQLERSFREHWDRPALSNYHGPVTTYARLAEQIAKIHIMFESCHVKKGDKIAICSKNQATWPVAFLASLTYGAVPVPILNEFKPGSIHHIVNHSDSIVLFVGDNIWDSISMPEMPGVEACFNLNSLDLVYYKRDVYYGLFTHIDEVFKSRYPSFSPADINYYQDSPDELAMISYTSGSTGFSKGVMLPYRSLAFNVAFAYQAEPHMNEQSRMVAMLPTAHMYGLLFDLLYEMNIGAHVVFITRLPSPRVVMQAMDEIKPDAVVLVPMIIEKIYKTTLLPIISKKRIKWFLSVPRVNRVILNNIHKEMMKAFGGNFKEVLVGGAPLNREVEAFMRRIRFPFTVGYGMTECGPILTYIPHTEARLYSCGKPVKDISMRVDSPDPAKIPGEILVKGPNVFLGYYKNEDATRAAFDEEGWFHTGDMGVMDKDGYLYLKGRCKSMILGPSGQNIYPEEIESSLNNLPYVGESLVIDDGGVLTALIYPDFALMEEEGLEREQVLRILEEEVQTVNITFPEYYAIKKVEIYPEEFEKTPKRNIKRYLYQR